MNQDEAIEKLRQWKNELETEVISHFRAGDRTRGKLAFDRWKERFVAFLETYFPSEVNRFKGHTNLLVLFVVYDESPLLEFMREYGNTCLAFIDDLINAVQKEHIKITNKELKLLKETSSKNNRSSKKRKASTAKSSKIEVSQDLKNNSLNSASKFDGSQENEKTEELKPFWYQKGIFWLGLIIGGILFFGAALDAISNAMTLFSPSITYFSTAILIFFTILISIYLKKSPPVWITDNRETRINQLSLKHYLTISGFIILLWIPRIIDFFQDKNIPQPENTAIQNTTQQNKAVEGAVLELQERLRPRSLTEWQKTQLFEILQKNPKGIIKITCIANNSESENFAMEFSKILQNVGWQVEFVRGISSYGVTKGITVRAKNLDNPQAVILRKALEKVGLEVEPAENSKIPQKDLVILVIGEKP